MLDGNILAPRKGIPSCYDKREELVPVFITQTNFVKTGSSLPLPPNTTPWTLNGQGHLIALFAKTLKGELFMQTVLSEATATAET